MTQDTPSKILDTAEKLIITKGFNAFSYQDISKKVGIKTASIHYHFPTKDDLSLAVVTRFRERFSTRLKALEDKESSGLVRVEQYGKALLDAFDKGKGFCLCVSLASDEATLSQDTSKAVKDFFTDSENWVKKAIQDGQAQGEIDPELHPKRTATSIVGLFEGTLIVARAYKDEKPLKDVIRWARDILGKNL